MPIDIAKKYSFGNLMAITLMKCFFNGHNIYKKKSTAINLKLMVMTYVIKNFMAINLMKHKINGH